MAVVERQCGIHSLDSSATGLKFTNQLSETLALNNQILENGAGIALGDVDGDGWCDIYLCGAENSNKLFNNLGAWKFADITGSAGVACAGQFSTGAVLADLDGDGDLDLLVNGLGVGTRCFLNDGRGHFPGQCVRASNVRWRHVVGADRRGRRRGPRSLRGELSRLLRHDPPPPKITRRRWENPRVAGGRFAGFLRADGQIEVVERANRHVLPHNGKGKFRAVAGLAALFWMNKAILGKDRRKSGDCR